MFMQYKDNSSWEEIDYCEELYPGIYLVSTPSHGGTGGKGGRCAVKFDGQKMRFSGGRLPLVWGGLLRTGCTAWTVLDKGLGQIPDRIKAPDAFKRSLNSMIEKYYPEILGGQAQTEKL